MHSYTHPSDTVDQTRCVIPVLMTGQLLYFSLHTDSEKTGSNLGKSSSMFWSLMSDDDNRVLITAKCLYLILLNPHVTPE